MSNRTPQDDRSFHAAIGFETTKATCGGPSMREDSRRITSNRARTLGSIAVIAVLVCVSATGGTAAKVKAIKVNPITVDGNITDWAGVPTFYLQEGPRVTAIAHDERFLYVHFRFSDAKLARQLLMTGAIVWVNGDGKHEAGFGVRYRGSAAIEETLGQSQGREGGPPAPPPGTESPSGRPDSAGGAQGASEVKKGAGPSPARRLGGPTPRRSERGGSVRRAAGWPRRGERRDRRRVFLRVPLPARGNWSVATAARRRITEGDRGGLPDGRRHQGRDGGHAEADALRRWSSGERTRRRRSWRAWRWVRRTRRGRLRRSWRWWVRRPRRRSRGRPSRRRSVPAACRDPLGGRRVARHEAVVLESVLSRCG